MSPADRHDWLPDFCRVGTFFVVMVAVETVVLAAVLMPGTRPDGGARDLFTASLFAQWLALLATVMLCKLRPWLLRRPMWAGALLAWLIPVLTTLLGAAAVHRLDRELGLDMTVAEGFGLRFAMSCTAIAALLAAALLRYFYIQQQWTSQVRAHARAEVQALQARIRPHFLFNSMNSIASLVRRDPETAERAVEDLADLFRAALGAGQGDSTLQEELALVRRYLAIEALRLGDRLRVDWQLDDELPLDLSLPRLLLQPLVENAVIHGVARLEHGGEIRIAARMAGLELVVRIDNPCPDQAGWDDAAGAGNRHAQNSVSQRLLHHCGNRARMTLQREPGYYGVELRMPA